MLVKDLLPQPPEKIITVRPDSLVQEAARLLSDCHIGMLLVTDYMDDIAGVLSERDVVAALGDPLVDVDTAIVGDLMTRSIVSITPQDSLANAMSAMNKHGIRHLVTLVENRPVAIISIRDVLQAFASDLLKNDRIPDSHPTKEFVVALAAYQGAKRLSVKV